MRGFYLAPLVLAVLLIVGLAITVLGIRGVRVTWNRIKTKCEWNWTWDNGTHFDKGDLRFWVCENKGDYLNCKVVWRTLYKRFPLGGENRGGWTEEYWEEMVRWYDNGVRVENYENDFPELTACFAQMFNFDLKGKETTIEIPLGSFSCYRVNDTCWVHSRLGLPLKYSHSSPNAEVVLKWTNYPLQVQPYLVYLGIGIALLATVGLMLIGTLGGRKR